MERTELLARLQEIREQPASKAKTTHRAELVGRMRRIAGLCKAEHQDEEAGAVALLHEINPTSPDHIALAIAAHKLLVKVVVRDLTSGGETEPEYPRIISLLTQYLDGCGYMYSDGAFQDTLGFLAPAEKESAAAE